MLDFIFFAAEAAGEQKNHTAFYVVGGLLAAWAVVVSAIGIRGHADWPSNQTTANAVMGISAVLVVAACATAVVTA